MPAAVYHNSHLPRLTSFNLEYVFAAVAGYLNRLIPVQILNSHWTRPFVANWRSFQYGRMKIQLNSNFSRFFALPTRLPILQNSRLNSLSSCFFNTFPLHFHDLNSILTRTVLSC